MPRRFKTITIRYGILQNPDNRRIDLALEKWAKKGYTLKSREESPAGFAGWGGKTHLTFELVEKSKR